MERIVPRTATEEVDLYIRTVYSLLRSSSEVQIKTLEEVHAGMNSLLHPKAREISPDVSAFVYTILRLPDCISSTRLIVLGQSAEVFKDRGYPNVEKWQRVFARARRRRCFYNGIDTMACFIASRSDIDDVIPVLTAFQIEWNKLNNLLQEVPVELFESVSPNNAESFSDLADYLQISSEDLERLYVVWGSDFEKTLQQIAATRCNFSVRLLAGSLSQYWRATRSWWENVERRSPDVLKRPVYFVSSNTHSIINVLSGFTYQHENDLISHITKRKYQGLLHEWEKIGQGYASSSKENFL